MWREVARDLQEMDDSDGKVGQVLRMSTVDRQSRGKGTSQDHFHIIWNIIFEKDADHFLLIMPNDTTDDAGKFRS
jgi:hypothetical protein